MVFSDCCAAAGGRGAEPDQTVVTALHRHNAALLFRCPRLSSFENPDRGSFGWSASVGHFCKSSAGFPQSNFHNYSCEWFQLWDQLQPVNHPVSENIWKGILIGGRSSLCPCQIWCLTKKTHENYKVIVFKQTNTPYALNSRYCQPVSAVCLDKPADVCLAVDAGLSVHDDVTWFQEQ